MYKRPPYFNIFIKLYYHDDYKIKKEQDRFWEGADLVLAAKLPHTIQAMIVYHVADIKMDLVCWRYFHYVSNWCTYQFIAYDGLLNNKICTKLVNHIASPFCVIKTINSIALSTDHLILDDYIDDSIRKDYLRDDYCDEQEENDEEEDTDSITFGCRGCYYSDSSITITKQRYNEISLYPLSTTTRKENIRIIESQILQSIEYLYVRHAGYNVEVGGKTLHLLLMNLPNLKSFIYNPYEDYEYYAYTIKYLGGRKNLQAIIDRDHKADDDNNEIDDSLTIDNTLPVILEEINISITIDLLSIIKIITHHQSKIQHFTSQVKEIDNEDWEWFINQLQSINLPNKQHFIVEFGKDNVEQEFIVVEVPLMDINNIVYSQVKGYYSFTLYNKYFEISDVDILWRSIG